MPIIFPPAPPAPSLADPLNFDSRTDAFLAWMSSVTGTVNALDTNINAVNDSIAQRTPTGALRATTFEMTGAVTGSQLVNASVMMRASGTTGLVPLNNTGFVAWLNLQTGVSASIITTDTFNANRIPALPTSRITGLDAALAGKANNAHSHSVNDVSGLSSTLSGLAPKASPTFTGVSTFSIVRAANGSAGTPSLSFGSDTNTGMYSDSSDQLKFSIGGTLRGRITSDGFVGGGAGLTNISIGNIPGLQAALDGRPGNSRVIFAGNGLTGGGDLSQNRTISLGTPDTITATSDNTVSSNGHTHKITGDTIRALVGERSNNALGTYALLRFTGLASERSPGFTTSGSNLNFASCDGSVSGTGTAAGSWELHGYINGNSNIGRTSLWLRYL